MAEQTRRITDAKTVTLDGNGDGEVTYGPGRPNTRMRITGVGVQTSTSTLVPTAKVYQGSADPGRFVSGTYNGALNSDNELDIELWPGEQITVRWENGDVGATATATFRGEEITGVA